ncbi:hypothetical protein BLNAU_8078 [Blattamonas nauphoetae]|uniref:Uncharacterized protein n=1 Tax=Blattamonas nauphoetae TaxID=2049346 RepID=A0ABQ9XZS0_9EUKA|nr:hypothetical protein BLNAU_8078 [Blattamonas nauphoetae]
MRIGETDLSAIESDCACPQNGRETVLSKRIPHHFDCSVEAAESECVEGDEVSALFGSLHSLRFHAISSHPFPLLHLVGSSAVFLSRFTFFPSSLPSQRRERSMPSNRSPSETAIATQSRSVENVHSNTRTASSVDSSLHLPCSNGARNSLPPSNSTCKATLSAIPSNRGADACLPHQRRACLRCVDLFKVADSEKKAQKNGALVQHLDSRGREISHWVQLEQCESGGEGE